MANKKFKLGKEGRDVIKVVASQMGDIVGKTLGPGGRNYLTDGGITNDGKRIIDSIRYKDECEDLVSIVLGNVAQTADDDGGDGTTTATVVASKLALDLVDKVSDMDIAIRSEEGLTPMEMSRQLDEEKDKAIKLLEKQVTKVETLEQLQDVAFTAMENKEVGDMIADAVYSVGADGYVALEEGFLEKVEVEKVPGVQYPVGMVAPFQYTNSKNEGVYTGINVLLCNHYFTSLKEINKLMEQMGDKKEISAFAIVAKGFEAPFIGAVYDLQKQANFRIVLLKTNMSDDEFDDLGAYLDCKVINTSPRVGMKTENATLSSLGFAKKLIGKEKTAYFVGGRGTESIIMVPDVGPMKLVEERIKSLRDLLETKKDKFDKVLNSRISQLAGGIAVIRVGAKSQAEKFYLKLKIEDARNSCLSALKYGVVPGGGLAYQKVAEELGPDALIYEALMEPAKRIQKNFGRKFDVAKNIVDSFGVSKSSLVSAISVVKTLITMEGIIAEEDVTLVDQLNKKLIGE